jgi:hypothetical protein
MQAVGLKAEDHNMATLQKCTTLFDLHRKFQLDDQLACALRKNCCDLKELVEFFKQEESSRCKHQ